MELARQRNDEGGWMTDYTCNVVDEASAGGALVDAVLSSVNFSLADPPHAKRAIETLAFLKSLLGLRRRL
jgi:hypothetical protein